ncbi:MAG: S8 family serine peptidase [Bacteroidota bacterium]
MRICVKKIGWVFVVVWIIVIPKSEAQIRSKASGHYEPHQIIISYEPLSGTRQSLEGSAILREHEEFVSAFQQQYRVAVRHAEPVFQAMVDKMVAQRISEPELLQEYRERSESRRGYSFTGGTPSYEIQFCRTLCLWVETKDVGPLVKQIEENATLLGNVGYKLTSISANEVYRLNEEPNDPWFSQQYAHTLTGASAAWDKQLGSEDIVIGVIDTGIDPNHEDLVDNLLPGRDFVNLSSVEPWQRVEGEDYFGEDDDPSDTDGHGTAVSGVVAAKNNNGIGVAGVCPNCKILPIRAFFQAFLEDEIDGRTDTILESTSDDVFLARSVTWAIDQGADILNFSFGGESPNGRSLVQAIRLAVDNGIVMIGAAGNEDSEAPQYPAANESVISVASTNANDQRSSFSSYGTWVDVSAPGSQILTTWPVGEDFSTVSFAQLDYVEDRAFTFNPLPLTFSGFTRQGGLATRLEFVGLGRAEDISNPAYNWDLEGKIALLRRGEITFKEKVDRVKSFGAVGAIIFNNVAGNFGGTLQEAQENPIPVVSISQNEGESLLEEWQADQSLEVSLNLEELPGYTSIDGTSFAAPYVAGMAGLILSEKPTLDPIEVKNIILASVDNIDAQNPNFFGKLGTGRVNLSTLFADGGPLFRVETEEDQLLAFPNPVQDVFRVSQLSEAEITRLRIVNNLGQEVYRMEDPVVLQQFTMTIDISHLPNGHYILLGDSPSGNKFQRIVKASP